MSPKRIDKLHTREEKKIHKAFLHNSFIMLSYCKKNRRLLICANIQNDFEFDQKTYAWHDSRPNEVLIQFTCEWGTQSIFFFLHLHTLTQQSHFDFTEKLTTSKKKYKIIIEKPQLANFFHLSSNNFFYCSCPIVRSCLWYG